MFVLGGDVWVLVIRDVKASDAGIYVCEVNSNPILRSFHTLEGKKISYYSSFRTSYRLDTRF